MKIAMWSGPRNLSTAMMYAFGNRPDFAVWDEPFYAPYLAKTGYDHPMADQITAAHEVDPIKVAARCVGPIPDGKPHFYMKHMPHHISTLSVIRPALLPAMAPSAMRWCWMTSGSSNNRRFIDGSVGSLSTAPIYVLIRRVCCESFATGLIYPSARQCCPGRLGRK